MQFDPMLIGMGLFIAVAGVAVYLRSRKAKREAYTPVPKMPVRPDPIEPPFERQVQAAAPDYYDAMAEKTGAGRGKRPEPIDPIIIIDPIEPIKPPYGGDPIYPIDPPLDPIAVESSFAKAEVEMDVTHVRMREDLERKIARDKEDMANRKGRAVADAHRRMK